MNKHIGDLLMSIGKNPYLDDDACRIFLYLFAQSLDGVRITKVTIDPEQVSQEIGISYDNYKKASRLILDQKIMRLEQGKDSQEMWEINP